MQPVNPPEATFSEGDFLGGLNGYANGASDFGVTGDGHRCVMLEAATQSLSVVGNVMLVINWFEELNRLVPTDP